LAGGPAFEVSGGASLEFFKGAIPVIYSSMAYFYEIRSPDNAVLKRDGGFADVEAAKRATGRPCFDRS
jgi:hypothetical protein